MPEIVRHPTPVQLAAFARGQLDGAAQAEVERHVEQCDACCRALQAIPDDTMLQWLRHAKGSLGSLRGPGGATVPPPPGATVGALADHPRYRVVRFLGAGGMGAVYQAEHRVMGRPVALKVIDPALLDDPGAVERFRREVRAAARLAHPNIVRAFDAGQAGDLHFLVMEYVDGVSLARLVERDGPLPVDRACAYARQAALGLQHAHEHGMVHRDIKPQNLMLTEAHGRPSVGLIKLLDFGLARLARERGAGGKAGHTLPGTSLTREEMFLGTPDFIAPEQAHDARRADIRADVYSLGCTLYFLLAGRVPFPEGSAIDKLLAHANGTPRPVRELRPEVPPALAEVLGRMMTRDPAGRYPTPAEAAAALGPFTEAVSPAAARPRRRGRRALLALGLLVAAGAVLGWAATRDRAPTAAGPRGPESKARVEPPGPAARLPVLVVVPQRFSADDYWQVRRALDRQGAAARAASSSDRECQPLENSGAGGPVTPEVVLDDRLRPADCGAALFVGGYVWEFKDDTPNNQPAYRAAGRLITDLRAAGRPVAAVSGGIRVLAAHGALKDRKVSANLSMLDDWLRDPALKASGAAWVNEPVVADGAVLTAFDPRDGDALVRALLQSISVSRR